MHRALCTLLVKEAQDLLFVLLNLRTPTLSGLRAGLAPPSLGYPEFGSDTPSLREPGILNILQRENIVSGSTTCPQTPGVWLQCRDEATRLSSWASQGVWKSLYHTCSDLPSADRQAVPPGGRGVAKLKSRALFPPHAPLHREYRRLSCLSSTYFSFFLFYVSRPFCAACPPKSPCGIVENVPEGSPERWVAIHPGSAPNSPCDTELGPCPLWGLSFPTCKMMRINQMLSRVFFRSPILQIFI